MKTHLSLLSMPRYLQSEERNVPSLFRFANTLFLLLFLFLLPALSFAQHEEKRKPDLPGLSGITKNVIIGYAYSDFSYNPGSEVKTNFTKIGFSPTMIWKLGDKLFFESQVEFFADSGSVIARLEYSKLSYMLNKYVTIGMGKMLTPFGVYTERFEVSFIERLPNAPLGFKHHEGMPNIGPMGAEMGVDVRGGFQVGDAKMNYIVYVSNGARLNDGVIEPKLGGAIDYENFFDNNSNKSVGGRIGFLPLSNSSLELGASYSTCIVGDPKTIYKDVRANAYGGDISYHKTYPGIKSQVNLKGQLNYLAVDKAYYPAETGGWHTFENNSDIWYARFSIRPVLVENHLLKNTEFLVRYNENNLAHHAEWGGKTTRMDVGIAYWLSVRTGLRLAYEKTHLPNGTDFETVLMRFVTGF